MRKVKVFSGYNGINLEKKVNEWLIEMDKKIKDILYIVQSQASDICPSGQSFSNIFLTILYSEYGETEE